jgi:ArsR family transcriptional regulator
VDNSAKRVEYGTSLARENGIHNLEYRLGDIEEPPIDAESVDLVVFSQALHHAGSPQRAVHSAHRILRPGGRVVILDLLAHQFEQARELYADTWLGFSESALTGFFEDAGFIDPDVQVVSRDPENPAFQTLLALAVRPR